MSEESKPVIEENIEIKRTDEIHQSRSDLCGLIVASSIDLSKRFGLKEQNQIFDKRGATELFGALTKFGS